MSERLDVEQNDHVHLVLDRIETCGRCGYMPWRTNYPCNRCGWPTPAVYVRVTDDA